MTEHTGKCPFCGRAETVLLGDTWQAYVKCTKCEARGPVKRLPERPYVAERLAVREWNSAIRPTGENVK